VKWFLALGIGALAASLYVGSLGNEFTFDDAYIIAGNPMVTGRAPLSSVFTSHYWAGTDAGGDLYRPLTIASYRLNRALFGPAPWSFHLVNLLLHGLATALLLILLERITGSLETAAPAAILFAAHPIHVEAVASAVGRAELMAAIFLLSAWILRDRALPSALFFAGALLSKESAVALPALMLLEDWLRPASRRGWRAYAIPSAVVVLWLGVRLAVLTNGATIHGGPFDGVPAFHRILTALSVMGRCLALLFWPAHLSADYSRYQIPVVTSPLDPGFLAGAAATSLCLAAAWFARRRFPAIAAGTVLCFVALAPISNLLFGIGVVMAERLLYLPSAGFCLAVAGVIACLVRAAGARRLVAAGSMAATLLAVPLGVRAWLRCGDWRDEITLFEATARSSPRSSMAHFGLGAGYQDAGRLAEAEAEYRLALAIDPDNVEAGYNLATLLERLDRIDEAMDRYREVLRLLPVHRRAHNNLGILYRKSSRDAEAEAEFREAIVSGAETADPYFHLATLLEFQGRSDEAVQSYRDGLVVDPDDVQVLNNLGRSLLAARRPIEAIEVLERAVTLKPGAVTPAVNLSLAWLAAGDRGRAEKIARGVLSLHPDDAGARRALFWASGRSETSMESIGP